MADQECDMDELEALLDKDDDEEAGAEDQDELDLLASLVEEHKDSSELTLETKNDKSSADPQTNGYKPKDTASNTHTSLKASKSQGQKTEAVTESISEPDPNLVNADLLREEMKQMQKRMMELQKLIEQQHQPVVKTINETSLKSPLQEKKLKREEVKSKPLEKKTKPPVPCNSKMKLLPDDGGDLFFGQASSCNLKEKKKVEDKVKNSLSSKSKEKQLAKELLGGDSDSDWDDLDGEDKKVLSDEGKDLKRLLQSRDGRREAHQPKFKVHDSEIKSTSWARPLMDDEDDVKPKKEMKPVAGVREDKNSLQCKVSSTDQAKQPTESMDEKFVVDDFSKIRIVNPLVSSAVMRMRMDGRKMISVSKIHLKLKAPELQGDWVTIAVVVGKSDSKSSKTGKTYCIWRLNDLQDLENSVSFFLFGEVYKAHWKLEVGTVIGVLNPSIMESLDKANSEPAFTIKSPNQLLVMGRSKDLGWCHGRTKSGNKCTKFLNKKYGDFCSYHVQAEYRKTASKRLELHGSIGGVKPKSFDQKVFSKDCAYIYGGQTFVPYSNSNQKKSKKAVTLAKLQDSMSQGKLRVNTLTLNDVSPSVSRTTAKAQAKGPLNESESAFMDMITTPSPGSMNLVAFLKKKESVAEKSSSKSKSNTSRVSLQSINPKDLLKQHKQQLKEKKDEATLQRLKTDPLKEVPKLGKGFYSGQEISLDISPKRVTPADRNKLKAIAKLQSIGGVKKEDPNAVRSQKDPALIKKKVTDQEEKSASKRLNSEANSASPSSSSPEPPKKRSRLLGNVDINSEEVRKILKAKSKHQGALTEAELEREEAYFTHLEKKEMMEEKMQSVTSIEISVFTCKQCRYTAQSAAELCKKEGHTITKSKAKKRFFACKKCKHRTCIIGDKFVTEACKKCGASSFEKTSMYKEKAGPKLESEVLSLRGDEVKYLNSMDQKIFLNTVVDN